MIRSLGLIRDWPNKNDAVVWELRALMKTSVFISFSSSLLMLSTPSQASALLAARAPRQTASSWWTWSRGGLRRGMGGSSKPTRSWRWTTCRCGACPITMHPASWKTLLPKCNSSLEGQERPLNIWAAPGPRALRTWRGLDPNRNRKWNRWMFSRPRRHRWRGGGLRTSGLVSGRPVPVSAPFLLRHRPARSWLCRPHLWPSYPAAAKLNRSTSWRFVFSPLSLCSFLLMSEVAWSSGQSAGLETRRAQFESRSHHSLNWVTQQLL